MEVGTGDWQLGPCGTRGSKCKGDLEQSQASCLMPEADRALYSTGTMASDEAVSLGRQREKTKCYAAGTEPTAYTL